VPKLVSAPKKNRNAACVSNATLEEKGRRNRNSTTRCHISFGTLQRGNCQFRMGSGRAMFGTLRGFVIAAAFALPTAATAQLQVNQNFVTQGPAPSFGPLDTVQSGDAPPNGNVAGAVGPVVADPTDPNTLFVGTPAGGIWKTTNGGATWSPLTDKEATLSIASLAYDPTDPSHRTLIAGTGLTANGTVSYAGARFFTGSGGLQNGLLYSQDGGNTWTSLGAAALANQSVVAVGVRGNVMLAGTFEISGLGETRMPALCFAARTAAEPSRKYREVRAPVCPMGRSVRLRATPPIQIGFMLQ
jgi:hypothetical protein